MENHFHLEWHETSPGIFERQIDDFELFYSSMVKNWSGMGRSYFAITAYVGLSIAVPEGTSVAELEQRTEEALRKAWKKVRYDHPTLAAPVQYDPSTKTCKKIYHALSNEDNGDEWLNETFRLINSGQSGIEFANTDPAVGRYATLYLVTPPLDSTQPQTNNIRRDLVFRSEHDLIDGIGSLTLLNNFLGHAATAYALRDKYPAVTFGDEHKNLSPCLQVAAGIPILSEVEHAVVLKSLQEITAKRVRESKIMMGIPLNLKKNLPERSRRAAIHLTDAETLGVLKRCKEEGSTATHAFHAGIAVTVRDMQTRTAQAREGTYTGYSLVNLRRICHPPYNSPTHAASVYHGISTTSLAIKLRIPSASESVNPSTEEYASVLKQVTAFYTSTPVGAQYLTVLPVLYKNVTPPYPEGPPPEVPAPNTSPSVSLSSLGVTTNIVSPEHGPFVAIEPWVIGAEYSTGLGMFLSTWKGIMSLSVVYNEAFHEEDDVLTFLSRVRDTVLTGLEVI